MMSFFKAVPVTLEFRVERTERYRRPGHRRTPGQDLACQTIVYRLSRSSYWSLVSSSRSSI